MVMRLRSYAAPHLLASALFLVTRKSCQCLSSTAAVSSSSSKILVPPENLQAIEGLEPQSLWSQFSTLSSIPRPSKQEDAILGYIKDFAESRNLTWKQDPVGNLVVFHPGCGKHGPQAPPVILQGHVDMVTEKNTATKHNFETDPIVFRRFEKRSSPWLGARGTTLGADNGIGVAAALALLETDPSDETMELPPLEALFTVDEETGLTGAIELDAAALGLTGTTMLNLDTEEWGELYVGCAGGGESILKLPLRRQTATEVDAASTLVELRVEGLLGGHSGINIHEGRANAVLLCAAAAQAVLQKVDGVNLVSISGGDKHNAIPREARAQLLVGKEGRAAVEKIVQQCQDAAKAEFGGLEKNLLMTVLDDDENNDNNSKDGSSSSCPSPLEPESASRFLSMLLALPHGPIKFSHAMPDLVETSNNVASLTMSTDDNDDGDVATILCSTRSSIGSALETARDKLTAIATLAGASIERTPSYPGWNPNMDSPLLGMAKELLADRLKKEQSANDGTPPASVGIKAIHAGLECGLLIEKLGGNVDALSFGPTIEGAHSPDESIQIDTVPPFFDLVQDILAELAQKRE